MIFQLVTALCFISAIASFKLYNNKVFHGNHKLFSSWQEDLDALLDIDTNFESRRNLTKDLLSKVRDISKDVTDAVRERDINKIAPKKLKYGKALIGLQDFQKQLVSDIIPDVLTKGVPLIVEEGPKFIQKVTTEGPSIASKKFSKVRELSQDREKLQSKVKDLKREIRNLVKSTPEGLESPHYDVVQEREYYEIRRYAGYAVCSTPMIEKNDNSDDLGDDMASFDNALEMDPLTLSSSFNTLAKYVFGANTDKTTEESEKLSMTTPVIIDESSMSFVLPSDLTAETAPVPNSESVTLKNVEGGLFATREFTGITTENEINRQRAKLEDSLIADEILYDADSFQVLNYNPPFTVPWVRRNEVSFRILSSEDELPPAPPVATTVSDESNEINNMEISDSETPGTSPQSNGFEDPPKDDEDTFFSSPEAGD